MYDVSSMQAIYEQIRLRAGKNASWSGEVHTLFLRAAEYLRSIRTTASSSIRCVGGRGKGLTVRRYKVREVSEYLGDREPHDVCRLQDVHTRDGMVWDMMWREENILKICKGDE